MRPDRRAFAAGAALLVTALAGCSPAGSDSSHGRSAPTPSTDSPKATAPTSTPAASETGDRDRVVGTIVRFTAGSTVVEVTITEDSAATRDFLSRLPMTQEFENFHGQEKITYPEEPFDYTGAEGFTPQVGDLFSYKPWGNLGFFYDVEGLGRSDDLVRLGTTDDLDAVMELDGMLVTIDLADH